ncbi:MAG TPA: ABC transporter permease [Terriglobales bacterium]|nr:ABC transporter permease [Terriglobales bacterium]
MKLLTIIKREFLSRVRTKGFLFFTFGIPVIAAGFLFLEYRIVQASQNVSSNLAVVDLSQQLYPALAQALDTKLDNGEAAFHVHQVAATAATLPAVEAQLRQQVLAKQEDGYLIIPADVLTSHTAQYHARNAAAVAVRESLQAHLREAVTRARMAAAGIPTSQIAGIVSGGFSLNQLKVTKTGDSTDNGETAVVAMVLVFVLYLFLLLYGVVVMKAVTEEKTTRISEVLLAAVDPFALMLGKILGVVATALAQLAVWAATLLLVGVYGVAMARAAGADFTQYVPHLPAWLLVCFVIFFLLGFLLYASLYAAIGAVVSSDQEAQQTQMPLTMVLVAAIYLAFLVMASPSSTLSVALSLFPFFAPVLMVVRVAVSNPPVWQVLLAMALCLATFLGCTKVTAKIYRVDILMTGKRPNLPELLRWLKYA